MRLPDLTSSLSRIAPTSSALGRRVKTTTEVAGALLSTARGVAPGLVKEVPHLVTGAVGGAWGLGTSVVRRLRGGEAYAPPLGEGQVSDVETERDRLLPEPVAPPAPADELPAAAVEVGAPGAAAQAVEKAVHRVEDAGADSGADLAHDQLPLEDYDHLTIGALRGRIRKLTLTELVQIRGYELAHANRLPVVTSLDNRIAKLQAEQADSGAPVPVG